MEYKNLKNSSLIDKCVDKDPLAWAEFVRRFSPLIAFSIKKVLSQYATGPSAVKEEVKDIRQNIMLALWGKNKLEEVKNRENVNYWLAIISRNAAINYLKTKGKEVLITDELYFEKLPAKAGKSQIDDRGIKEIYRTLSPKEKLTFRLYFEKELGLKDISKIIRAPIGTVSSIVTRMRKKFKK